MSSEAAQSPSTPLTYSRTNPYYSKIIERKLLSKPGSTKSTYHISLAIDPSVQFASGDSIAIIPENPHDEILELLQHITFDTTDQKEIFNLLKKKNFQMVTAKFAKALQSLLSHETLSALEENLLKEDFLKTFDLISFVKQYKPVKPVDFQQFLSWLSPITPRFYSIASSPTTSTSSIDLLVSSFSYNIQGREVFGLGSSFLCKNTDLNQSIPIFVQPSKAFRLPENKAPIIMIGPGTGVAPFRAFIQERVQQNIFDNWLFFGERQKNLDFYYEEEFMQLSLQQKLKLSLAFSRDQSEKIYVQHLIEKEKETFYDWMKKGAVIYVCGDAKEMAKDVQNAIENLIAEKENLSIEESKLRFKLLKNDKKIIFEVY